MPGLCGEVGIFRTRKGRGENFRSRTEAPEMLARETQGAQGAGGVQGAGAGAGDGTDKLGWPRPPRERELRLLNHKDPREQREQQQKLVY